MNQEMTIPKWWRAWETLAPRLIMAGQGTFSLRREHFDCLIEHGFDVAQLQFWNPNRNDLIRLKNAESVITKSMKDLNFETAKRKIGIHLTGDGVWGILRNLAEIYINGQKKESSQLIHKSNNNLIVKSQVRLKKLENNPKDSRENIINNINMSNFGEKISEFTIYIDEAWPGAVPDAAKPRNEGVISGLICYGNSNIFFKNLPHINTHSYKDQNLSKKAMVNLLSCDKCLPFIFPIYLPKKSEQAIAHYDLLLQQAIKLLLGWVLPKRSASATKFSPLPSPGLIAPC